MRVFAYGTLIDPQTMHLACAGAEDLGRAVLDGYELAFTAESGHYRGGVPDIVEAPGSSVEGVLWAVDGGDLAVLDTYEGVDEGFYERIEVEVDWRDRTVDAQAYTVVDKIGDVDPAPKVLTLMRRGAKRHDLEGTLEALEEITRRG